MNKMSIHILPDNIQIETVKDGRKSIKNTDLRSVQEVLTRGERIETPLLPGIWGTQKYLKVNNREVFVITTPPHIREVAYDYSNDNGQGVQKYTIPLPGFTWMIANDVHPGSGKRRYVHGIVYANKNQVLTENDQLYRWPFANVGGSMCWGAVQPEISGSKSIQTIPDQFLTNPFNSDLDGDRYQPFTEKIKGRTVDRFRCNHLIEHLHRMQEEAEKKGENAEFRYDCLRPARTFGNAVERFISQSIR